MAFDAASGKNLWRLQTGAGLQVGPMTFMHNGKQYVVVASGGTVIALVLPDGRYATRRPSSGLGHRGRFAEPRGRRAAGEQLSTIGKRDRLRVCDRLTGLGAVAFDLDLRARRD